jgi:hypothetical protein
MKNVRSFEDFLLEGKQLFLGENIFIDVQPDNYFEGAISEAKKFIDQKELADEVKKSLAEGETVYILITVLITEMNHLLIKMLLKKYLMPF